MMCSPRYYSHHYNNDTEYNVISSTQIYWEEVVDVRGNYAYIYSIAFSIAPALTILLVVVVCMTMLFWMVQFRPIIFVNPLPLGGDGYLMTTNLKSRRLFLGQQEP